MDVFEFAVVDHFPEPAFSALQRDVFANAGRIGDGDACAPSARKTKASFRVGAYCKGELVGWSFGWGNPGGTFTMANSGVVAAYRRRGIYSQLVRLVLEHAEHIACVQVISRHSATNNPAIIAKLRLGFQVSGFTRSGEFGPTVH